MNLELQRRILALRHADAESRARLAQTGELFDGYNAEMERVHRQNAAALEDIIEEHGWPGISLVGAEGCEAAWLVAQHAIGLPTFQLRCLELISAAIRDGEAPARHAAYLIDRIRFNQRHPQIYGTIFDWDEKEELSAWRIERPEGVDERRAAVGLPALAQAAREMRRQAASEGNRPPEDIVRWRRETEAWARAAGWVADENELDLEGGSGR